MPATNGLRGVITTYGLTGALATNVFGGSMGGFSGVGTNNFGTNLTPTGRTNEF